MPIGLVLENPEVRRGALFAAVFLGSAIVYNGMKHLLQRAESKADKDALAAAGQRRKAADEAKAELTPLKLASLEWRRYEELVEGFFRAQGYKPQRTHGDHDGADYLYLYRGGLGRPEAYVRFKSKGYCVSTREAPDDAAPIVAPAEFVAKFNALPQPDRAALIATAFRDDYSTPTCPKCEIKMVLREDEPTWSCRNFPRCRQTLPLTV